MLSFVVSVVVSVVVVIVVVVVSCQIKSYISYSYFIGFRFDFFFFYLDNLIIHNIFSLFYFLKNIILHLLFSFSSCFLSSLFFWIFISLLLLNLFCLVLWQHVVIYVLIKSYIKSYITTWLQSYIHSHFSRTIRNRKSSVKLNRLAIYTYLLLLNV